MPSLPELQRAFVEGVLRAPSADFLRHVLPGPFPADRHFQVYRNNVFENFTAALKAVYPVTGRLVGEGFFRYLATTYIPLHPPRGGNLHDFGGQLPEFLEDFAPARELVYLPDVARLEWAWHESFHAADGAALDVAALAAVPAERHAGLEFALQPSARLVSSPHPVLRIWQVNQEGFQGNNEVSLDEGGARMLVIRRRQVEIEPLDAGDYNLLSAFAAGQSFARAAESALQAQPDYDLATALQRHVAAGTLAGFIF